MKINIAVSTDHHLQQLVFHPNGRILFFLHKQTKKQTKKLSDPCDHQLGVKMNHPIYAIEQPNINSSLKP